jgi:Flp pilus assembly secretin CpaC
MVRPVQVFRSALMVSALVSSVAFASSFSVERGQTKVMGVSQRIVGITVRDPSVVEVRKLANGGGVTLMGRELGKTEIALRTVDGTEVEFVLYVTSEGAKVFSTSRDEGGSRRTLDAKKTANKEKPAEPEAVPETESEPTQVADTAIPPV